MSDQPAHDARDAVPTGAELTASIPRSAPIRIRCSRACARASPSTTTG